MTYLLKVVVVTLLSGVICVFAGLTTVDSRDSALSKVRRELPTGNLLVGYANWNECDEKLITAVEDGVNVLIWFAINLLANETTGEPMITGGPNLTCVGEIQAELKSKGLVTTHLISVGGWDAPHPNTSVPVGDVYANWVRWSKGLFDGFDWDLEGNDDPSSPNNIMTIDVLDLMGEMSQLAKADGYIVSMAPCESYIDPTTIVFDESLTHNYPEWEELQPSFNYHGHNTYTYLLTQYGVTGDHAEKRPTFDFISVQLYEGYTHFVYNTTIANQSQVDYLLHFVPRLLRGFDVNFTEVNTSLGVQRIQISATQLVLGFANGWADNSKFALVWPDVLGRIFETLTVQGEAPRGLMFWDIADEGREAYDPRINASRPFWMARGLNRYLRTRAT